MKSIGRFCRNLDHSWTIVGSVLWTIVLAHATPSFSQSLGQLPSPGQLVQSNEDPLSVNAKVTPFDLEPGQSALLELEMKLPEGYKAYLDMFSLEPTSPAQLKRGELKVEPIVEFFDEFTKKKRQGVEGTSFMRVNIEIPQGLTSDQWREVGNTLKARLTYQACTKTYCLFPKTIEIAPHFNLIGRDKLTAGAPEKSFLASFREGELWKSFFSLRADDIANRSLPLIFFIVFVAGFLTSLTPCVFPMIPITLAVLGKDAHARTKTQQVLVSHVYILGIALTYALLGLFAASTGALFGQFMSSPGVLGFICLMYLAMAMSMFGFYELELPLSIRTRLASVNQSGYLGVFLTGAASGIVASPCVGPVLVGILTYVAKTQNLMLGFWLLFVFALGMGQLFLILGISSQATKLLPRSGPWMETVKHVFGLGMLGAFFYFLQLLIPVYIFKIVLGVSLIVLGVKAGAFVRTTHHIRKGGALALFVLGVMVLAKDEWFAADPKVHTLSPSSGGQTPSEQLAAAQSESGHAEIPGLQKWHSYSDEILAQAKTEGKPVLIDFYADWCAACIELEKKTFPQPEFQKAAERFYLVRFDATNDSAKLDELKTKFEIIGLPTIVFLDSQGNWVRDATIVAFQNAPHFSEKMNSVK